MKRNPPWTREEIEMFLSYVFSDDSETIYERILLDISFIMRDRN
jgi:hypothetical protein